MKWLRTKTMALGLVDITGTHSESPISMKGSPPPSAMTCKGSVAHDRSCHFKNLYFNPKEDTYLFLQSPHSIMEGANLPSGMDFS